MQSEVSHVLTFLLDDQIAIMARRAFAQFHVVHQLHTLLDWESLYSVIQALVFLCYEHIDYCYVLYTGLHLKSIWKLQLVQNIAEMSSSRVP